MSKTSSDKKKADAKAEAKGKQAKIAKSKAKKAAEPKEEKVQKSSILNYGKCCTCKKYGKFPDGCGHMCRSTSKPTPRKATCEKYAYRD